MRTFLSTSTRRRNWQDSSGLIDTSARRPAHLRDHCKESNLVTLNGEPFYRLSQYDQLRPFLMTLVSAADHWLFISSTGALTAGRGNPDQALFPYYTEDKLHDSAEITGSKTLLRIRTKRGERLWEPFSERQSAQYRLERNLYKHVRGTQLIFEELNQDLGLVFRYGWAMSERFGFVRRAWLQNIGTAQARIALLDGIQNITPSGANSRFQLEKSVLLDAYKRNELVPNTGLGLFRLSSIPLDRPEPAEALTSTVVWSRGLKSNIRLLCSRQLDHFRQGVPLGRETDMRGERGAYFISANLLLPPKQTRQWVVVADINRTASQVAQLNFWLARGGKSRSGSLVSELEGDIKDGTLELEKLVAKADGLQKTQRPLGDARHYQNTLFNIMRGGIFEQGYQLDVTDLKRFIYQANHLTGTRHKTFFQRLQRLATGAGASPKGHSENTSAPRARMPYAEVVALAAGTGDPNLERLCREYLPLSFSRRHGDPSRPWNRFNIAPKQPDGSRALYYEGNWRDLFQNWEALALSFPSYVAGMVCRFVNASTADGYNPYRLTRDGIDWEVPDPADPWSHIGYWGDHQIIYLTKLLENLRDHDPATLRQLLTREIFCYANVPYRIKAYEQLVADPKHTVEFDAVAQELVAKRVQSRGTDGKLVWDKHERVLHVNLVEKLLVPVLAKLSNLIPDAGIWLNTQRPEWNDANNALVGNGASMVTVYYLYRHLILCRELLLPLTDTRISLSREVAQFLAKVTKVFSAKPGAPARAESKFAARFRRQVLDALGQAGSGYRQQLYSRGFSGGKTLVGVSMLCTFLERATDWLAASIRSNHRADGLYHAYNLADFSKPGELPLRRLYEMLEGQVAVLSSGQLSLEQSLKVLRALKRSAMYRADQHSYLLYPDRRLPGFLERNNIPLKAVAQSRLLRRLEQDGDSSVAESDCEGRWHFNGSLHNSADLGRVLDKLASGSYAPLVRKERAQLLQLFERVFDHQSFTGRSGTFFGYEGLGCIYWHMVSKLLLAVQETFFRAAAQQLHANRRAALNGDALNLCAPLRELAEFYWDIRSGLGDYKTPAQYGAVPMEPYSHTPGQGGVRQPGLTGQVKEDFLCRFGELGVLVSEGTIQFRPWLLRKTEFLHEPGCFEYYDVQGRARRLAMPANALGFTYCQLPIVYHLAASQSVRIALAGGREQTQLELKLTPEISQSIFQRDGHVEAITIGLSSRRFPLTGAFSHRYLGSAPH